MDKVIMWTNAADLQLNEAFVNLLEQSRSIETTARIIKELFESTAILKTNPDIYKLDILKTENRGNIRCYIKHGYRISYLVETDVVYILRVRYARKEPMDY